LLYYVQRNTISTVILSFKCKETQALFEGKAPKRFKAFARIAERSGSTRLNTISAEISGSAADRVEFGCWAL
jgi:hypothetical protein